MKMLPMNEVLKPISWLKGIWRTKDPGIGKFSTIETFKYCEEMSFSSIGQPMFNYSARSWRADEKTPLHYEVGFLKIIPDTNKIYMLLSHNFGVTTIEEGVFKDKVIKLKSTQIARPIEGTKRPIVLESRSRDNTCVFTCCSIPNSTIVRRQIRQLSVVPNQRKNVAIIFAMIVQNKMSLYHIII
ncbi:unnamed protein product, partial [Heterotrigona itama]